MIQGMLNDRNNIFLHMYYALLFLGSSNTKNLPILSQKITIFEKNWKFSSEIIAKCNKKSRAVNIAQ